MFLGYIIAAAAEVEGAALFVTYSAVSCVGPAVGHGVRLDHDVENGTLHHEKGSGVRPTLSLRVDANMFEG